MIKKCPKCVSGNTRKDGSQRGKQRYRCNNCRHVFQNQRRGSGIKEEVWEDWADHKQTYQELAERHLKERHWVQAVRHSEYTYRLACSSTYLYLY